jgi:DNA-binding NarL/FixJ family response regulator
MGEEMENSARGAFADGEKTFRTLLVEDNLTFRQVVKDLLNYRFPSMVVEEASNGKEAMEVIDNHAPNLVLMDIKLPGENGLELTKKITTRNPGIDVIILTSYDLPEYRQAAMQNGARSFVTKGSSTIDEIADLVGNFIKGNGKDSHA